LGSNGGGMHTKAPIERPKAFTVVDAARYAGFSESYLRLLIGRGKLAHVRCGRSIRLLVSDLDHFLESHRVEAE